MRQSSLLCALAGLAVSLTDCHGNSLNALVDPGPRAPITDVQFARLKTNCNLVGANLILAGSASDHDRNAGAAPASADGRLIVLGGGATSPGAISCISNQLGRLHAAANVSTGTIRL